MKTAIITGASSGVGFHLARALRDDYRILNLSRSNTETSCDVRSKQSIIKALEGVDSVDLLINSAGVMHFNSFMNIREDEIDEMYLTNVKGTFMMIQYVLPLMPDGGHVINISSIRGITGAPTKAAYAASKFAVQGLTDSLRQELGKSKIKITNICPGKIPESVEYSDIVKTVKYVLSLSETTMVRDIILGGQL